MIDNNLGYSDDDFVDSRELTEIEKVLHNFGNEMQSKLQNELRKQLDTGNLSQSVHFTAEIFGAKTVFKLTLADYYDYVNKGVQGLKTNYKAPDSPYKFGVNKISIAGLKGWAKRKGLNPFAVERSVLDKGTKGSKFFDKVVTTERLDKLANDLTKASKEDVRIVIDNTIKGVFGKTE